MWCHLISDGRFHSPEISSEHYTATGDRLILAVTIYHEQKIPTLVLRPGTLMISNSIVGAIWYLMEDCILWKSRQITKRQLVTDSITYKRFLPLCFVQSCCQVSSFINNAIIIAKLTSAWHSKPNSSTKGMLNQHGRVSIHGGWVGFGELRRWVWKNSIVIFLLIGSIFFSIKTLVFDNTKNVNIPHLFWYHGNLTVTQGKCKNLLFHMNFEIFYFSVRCFRTLHKKQTKVAPYIWYVFFFLYFVSVYVIICKFIWSFSFCQTLTRELMIQSVLKFVVWQ